ncbi:MAG: carbonic anhydrase [Desulfuromonadaceae bacterium]|nr:carbonic anhydrase [Desulfuromonadaceae bacterium]
MKVLKHIITATFFVFSTMYLAGASESNNKTVKEAEQGQAIDSHSTDHVASPSEPVRLKSKRKMVPGTGKPTAESARDVPPIDTEETINRIIGSNKNSAPKKKTVLHKKKVAHVSEEQATESAHDSFPIDAEDAVKRLLEGNRRYIAEKNSASHRTAKRRTEVSKGQHPFAIIVGCSDSRVPPEILFDQGIGDLFVVRSAGNVIDDIAIGSIEYAVEHLGVQLIMVLGHERCGVVDTTLKGGVVCGKLKSVIESIKPAVEKAKAKAKGQTALGCDLLCSSVKSNARMVAEKLKISSPVLTEVFENGLLRVVGAYYELDSGVVSLTYKPVL